MALNVEQEIATLDRVIHRLVVTEDDKLSAVLDKLLPKLLRKLNGAPAVRGKVIDALSHVSKRARPNSSITLPCTEMLAVCRDVPPTSFAFNFTLTFLEMAVPRLPPADQGVVAAQIAEGISRLPRYSPSQNVLLNLLLVVLQHLPMRYSNATAVADDTSGGSAPKATVDAPAQLAAEDLAVVADWFLDICLYPGVLTREGSAYHGLSPAGLARLTAREKTWPAELLTRRKLAVVRALKSDLFPPGAAVTPAVAACCSTHHEVLKAAEDLLKSLSSSDRNGTLRRDPAVAARVLNLVLGEVSPSPGTVATQPAPALSTARSPASSALAVRALAWLETECPDGTAARMPEAVRVSFLAIFAGGGASAGANAVPRPPGAPHHDRANEARFRAAGARLAAFVAARCNAAMLPMVGPLVLQAVQRVLTMNATPVSDVARGRGPGEDGASETVPVGASLLMQIQHAAMLEACYETIAALAVRRPQLFAGDTSVPHLLFSELAAKEPSLRVKISAALGALKRAYRSAAGDNLTSALWSLLRTAAASNEYRARLCAVEWACDLFDFSDVAARLLCISLCDDKVTAVRSAASRGLHPPASTASTAAANGDSARNSTPSTHPKFEAFVLGALREDAVPVAVMSRGVKPASVKDLPPVALARALDFALDCRKASSNRVRDDDNADAMEGPNGEDGEESEEAINVFVALIEATLMSAPSATDGQHGHAQMVVLHRSAAVALQKLVAGDSAELNNVHIYSGGDEAEGQVASRSRPVTGVAAKLASRGPWLQQWLGHEGSTEIREAFSETTGAAAEFMDPNTELVPLLRALGLKVKPCTMPGVVGFSNRAVSTAHGAVCAVGAILARLSAAAHSRPTATAINHASKDENLPEFCAWSALSGDALPSALASVAAAIGHPVSLLHVAACGAVGRVGAAGPLPVGRAISDVAAGTENAVGTDGDDSVTMVQPIFERLWTACKLGETSDASRRAEASAEALGRCCRGSGRAFVEHKEDRAGGMEAVSARVRRTLGVLSEMAKNQKEEELQFAVGAAVADVARSGPIVVPAGSFLEGMRTSARAAKREMKEAVPGAGARGDGEEIGATIDALDYVLYQVLYVLLEDHSPHVSGAAAVYLLAVVQRCRGHSVLAAYLPDAQAAFTRKLTVRSEFVQEVAGKGLALCYQAAGVESKQGLVDSLVDALSTGRRRAPAGASGVDVGGAVTHAGAALSEAGTGAYGEMCAVANDVGRPDLIYSFLSMASHHAAWTTRRGASFGLGAIVSQVSAEAFGEQLGRIVPRLFRYRFDPNAKTRSTMEQLWRSVVGGRGSGGDFSSREKELIRTNLSAIIVELLRALGERKWRDRQSACAALSDVLRGRGWDEIGSHLEQLWTMADRGLDDIKESVAEAAVDFAKTLSNVSVRLCDPYSFIPPHAATIGADGETSSTSGDASASAAAAAARSDAAGQGPDALREEAGEARRSIGAMMEDLRTSEAEARARGGEDADHRGGLASGEGRYAAADEVLRQALARERDGAAGTGGEDRGVGRVLGGRSGPTVDEILRPGRAGAERVGPPPSRAAQTAAGDAVSVTLLWLLRKGILSRCKASQGLSMRTLQRLVKVCDKAALMPHLAELVATLIEGLSALEPQALQYMQFHAETQLEMTQDQMERLRLSVSRAGPLQDALDQCYRHLDGPKVVEELMPRLLGLLRSGTGLATRSASAYLVLSLCERAPMEVRRVAPRLLPTLTNTALCERSSTLRRTYSSALSSVARLAPAAGVSRLAGRLAQLFREADPDFDRRQRRTLALLLGDLCRRAGGQLGAGVGSDKNGSGVGGGGGFAGSGWAQILPVAFVARRDPDEPVATAFEEAWQEGLMQLQLGAAGLEETSRVRHAKDAVLLMLPAILAEVSLAISSVSRVTKRQGCSGLKDLASTLGAALGEASSGRRLIRRVLSHIPGRTWEGKEELLEAAVALSAAGKGSAVTLEPFVWGASGAASTSRGVKRNRSEPFEGNTDAGEEEEEEEGHIQHEEAVIEQGHVADEVVSAATDMENGGPGGKVETETTDSGQGLADEDGTNVNGSDAVFQYEDKLGDLDAEATGADAKDLASAASSTASGEAASLDMEDDSPISFGEVVMLMMGQLQRKNTKFRRAAAVSLAALLNTFPECCVYEMVAPALLQFAGLDGPRPDGKEDPIMQARAVTCLASAWPRIVSAAPTATDHEAIRKVQLANAGTLTHALVGAMRRKVWSVRVPIFHVLAAVVSRSYVVTATSNDGQVGSSTMVSVLTGSLLADVVQAVEMGADDAKYSQVRAAAVSVVVAMTSRQELRLALTPHKEGLAKLARKAAEDPEPRVAVEGSKAAQNVSWWP